MTQFSAQTHDFLVRSMPLYSLVRHVYWQGEGVVEEGEGTFTMNAEQQKTVVLQKAFSVVVFLTLADDQYFF